MFLVRLTPLKSTKNVTHIPKTDDGRRTKRKRGIRRRTRLVDVG